jgi:hypothetical protein
MTTTMSLRNLALAMGLSAVFAAVGYGVGASRPKAAGPASGGGPSVVTFEGGGVTAEELRVAIEEQGPLLRASHAQPEALRRLALELARQKLVERDAEAKGYDRTPEIVRERRRALVALYLKKELEERQASGTFSEGELQGWLDQHRSEFAHPERARIADLLLAAPPSGKERERKRAEAEALLRDLRRRAPHDVYAFATAARGRSDDAATRAAGGELPLATREELEARVGREVAEAAFALRARNELVGRPIETAAGFHLVQLVARAEATGADLASLRPLVRTRLAAERRAQAEAALYAGLEARGRLQVDDAALGAVTLAPAKTASR